MHITLIFGAVLAELLETKIAAFLLLIGLKIAVDVAGHARANAASWKAQGCK